MPEHDRRILVVGAGMSGILAAIKLREAGFERVRVLEKAATLGGTWRDNVYPGLTCDIPSHLYSYSFAPNPDWSQRYSPGPEILAYLERTAREHAVDGLIESGREVARCEWDGAQWRVTDTTGRVESADCVIAATGILHHPYVPELPGAEQFAGALFHSARWDSDVAIDGKRVGIVGTGSTAVQLVQALAGRARTLALFQRTAQWVYPGRNKPYSPEERAQFRVDPKALAELRANLDASFVANLSDAMIDAGSAGMAAIEQACQAHLDRVRDPELRERLRPGHRAACKRLVVGETFYEAMQRENVELVTSGIERLESRGAVTADGRVHELDVLVLATGYRAHDFVRPMQVTGAGGRVLADVWQRSPYAYQTVSVPGFPNFFFVVGPHSPVANLSVIAIAELQVSYVVQLLDRLRRDGGGRAVSASEPATARYCETLRAGLPGTIWSTGCSSWFQDEEGRAALWPFSIARFRDELRAPRFEDFDVVA